MRIIKFLRKNKIFKISPWLYRHGPNKKDVTRRQKRKDNYKTASQFYFQFSLIFFFDPLFIINTLLKFLDTWRFLKSRKDEIPWSYVKGQKTQQLEGNIKHSQNFLCFLPCIKVPRQTTLRSNKRAKKTLHKFMHEYKVDPQHSFGPMGDQKVSYLSPKGHLMSSMASSRKLTFMLLSVLVAKSFQVF